MVCQNRPRPESELMCDARRGDLAARGNIHLFDESAWLARTVRSDGDGLFLREPSGWMRLLGR